MKRDFEGVACQQVLFRLRPNDRSLQSLHVCLSHTHRVLCQGLLNFFSHNHKFHVFSLPELCIPFCSVSFQNSLNLICINSPPKIAGYSLVEEDIVLRTRTQRSPDAVHVSLEDDHRYRAILNLISVNIHMYNCIDKKSMVIF